MQQIIHLYTTSVRVTLILYITTDGKISPIFTARLFLAKLPDQPHLCCCVWLGDIFIDDIVLSMGLLTAYIM